MVTLIQERVDTDEPAQGRVVLPRPHMGEPDRRIQGAADKPGLQL